MRLIKTFALSTILLTTLNGCYKPGCTDSLAVNFDEKAKQDDLSCSYTGNVVFWAKPGVSDSLIDLGHEMLRFELEGEIIDSIVTSGFSSGVGDCNTGGAKTIPMTFVASQERDYKYRVRGLGFQTIYEGIITIEVGDCIQVELQ